MKKRKSEITDSIKGAKKHCDIDFTAVEDNKRSLAGVGEDNRWQEL